MATVTVSLSTPETKIEKREIEKTQIKCNT